MPRFRDIVFGLGEFAKNSAMGISVIRDARLNSNRIRTSAVPEESLLDRYAFGLPKLVLEHLGSVAGKDVLEMGPGDHLATGLTFLALGANSYTTLDRLARNYSNRLSKQWYSLVREHFSQHFSLSWPSALSPETFPGSCCRVASIPLGVEELESCLEYDIVCSYAVAEHVSSVPKFASANKRLLRTGGKAIHVVDFHGHGWYRNGDEMLFTRIPKWAWSAMGSNRGYPNRVPFFDFNAILESTGLHVSAVNQKTFTNGGVREATFILSKDPGDCR